MRRQVLCLTIAITIATAALMPMVAVKAADPAPVAISARAAVLMEESTGRILMAKDEHRVLPPASVTKLMLMLLVMEAVDSGRIKLTDTVTASPEACSKGGSQIWLEVGEEMTVADLMKAVGIVSANDGSVALAEFLAGSEENCVRLMNDRAREIGMKNTYYANCTGLTPDTPGARKTETSAYDQALLAREVLQHPAVLQWTGTWIDHLRGGESFLRNTNNLVRFYDGCDGLKTGFTEEAGFCLVGTAQRDGVRLIAVVMNAATSKVRSAEISKLFNYGFSQCKAFRFYENGEIVARLPVLLGEQEQVPVTVARELTAVLDRNEVVKPNKVVSLPAKVTAPVSRGQVLGRVTVLIDGREYAKADLVAAAAVKRCGFWRMLGRIIRETFSSVLQRG